MYESPHTAWRNAFRALVTAIVASLTVMSGVAYAHTVYQGSDHATGGTHVGY